MEANRRTAKKKRRATLRTLPLVILFLLVGAGIVAAALLLGRSAVSSAHLTELPFTPAENAVYTGQGFLYIKDSVLYYDDLTNDKNSYHAQVSSPDVKLCGSPTLHALYNAAALKIVNATYPVEFTGTLKYVACGASCVAALKADNAGAESIQVFDKTGAQKDQLAFEGQFIENYGFYTAAGSEYLYVLTMSLDSGAPLTTITIYDMTRSSTSGVMQVQNQLIERTDFTATGIYAVGTNQIIRYSLEGNRESYREMVYGWTVTDYELASSPMYLLRPRSTEKPGTVKVLTLRDAEVKGTSQRLYQLPAGTVGAFLMGGRLVAVTDNGYTVFGADGKQADARTFPVSVKSAKKLDSSTLLLSTDTACYTARVG